MSDRTIRVRARDAGIATSWRDAQGRVHQVGVDSLRSLLRVVGPEKPSSSQQLAPMLVGQVGKQTRLGLNSRRDNLAYKISLEDGGRLEGMARRGRDGELHIPAVKVVGYHELELDGRSASLAIAPKSCISLQERCCNIDAKIFGLSAQIYGLRKRGDGGIGHLGAVGDLARESAALGADALAISPVHAMFSARPDHYSPYSPSSRLFLNVLLADMSCWFDAQAISQAAQGQGVADSMLRSLESQPLIDWPQATRCRLKILRALYDQHISSAPPAEMQSFIQAGGLALRQHAIFEALHAQQLERGPRGGNWRIWPLALRNADTPEVRRFGEQRKADVGFHLFMQWLTARSLERASEAARAAGMKIGLIADLAVGCDPSGSQCWTRQNEFLIGASVGAPPDELGPAGQNWGLTTFSPAGLRKHGYRAFIETLRASLIPRGGLRIDHVMGLERLWIIPEGGSSADGAYLTFPSEALMRLVALESHRSKSIVIGEDLGTVLPRFRERAASHAIMGMNVMWFERDAQRRFLPPAQWSPVAVAMTTTHDLPSAAGWWLGTDIGWRARLGQLARGQGEDDAMMQRQADRKALWKILRSGKEGRAMPAVTTAGAKQVVDAAARMLGATISPLAILPLEDVLGLMEQPNLPGTISEHPNWQRRYPAARRSGQLMTADAKRRVVSLREARGTS